MKKILFYIFICLSVGLTSCVDEDIEIKKGDCIGQAIFMPFLTVDGDMAEGVRISGFGSTNK